MKTHDEHVVCSRQLHGGGNQKIFCEHVVGHTSRFFYVGNELIHLYSNSIFLKKLGVRR